jgi:phosphatidylserine decarboxylase
LSRSERITVALQHLLPKRALTELAGAVARARGGALTTALVRWFIGRYGVNMAESANPDPAAYPSFNDFFTRAMAPGARPLASARWVCPVDGAISQFGAHRGRTASSRPRATTTRHRAGRRRRRAGRPFPMATSPRCT